MHVRELEWFRDNIAAPRMQELLKNTTINDGLCCINYLEISYLDGRSFGNDSFMKASGLIYKDGKVKEYKFEEYDISIEDFIEAHKDCVLLSDGKLNLWNELEETEIHSLIRNFDFCGRLFPELLKLKDLRIETTFLEFTKMQYLFKNQKNAKISLEEQMENAVSFGEKTHPATDVNLENYDDKSNLVASVTHFENDEDVKADILNRI